MSAGDIEAAAGLAVLLRSGALRGIAATGRPVPDARARWLLERAALEADIRRLTDEIAELREATCSAT